MLRHDGQLADLPRKRDCELAGLEHPVGSEMARIQPAEMMGHGPKRHLAAEASGICSSFPCLVIPM